THPTGQVSSSLRGEGESSISGGLGPGDDRQAESPRGFVHHRVSDTDCRPVVADSGPGDLKESLLAAGQVGDEPRTHKKVRAGVVPIGVIGQLVAGEVQLASERWEPFQLPADAEERPSRAMRIKNLADASRVNRVRAIVEGKRDRRSLRWSAPNSGTEQHRARMENANGRSSD